MISVSNKLDLTWERIGDEGLQALARVLPGNLFLQFLNLYNNEIGPEGAAALGTLLQENSTALLELHLGRNRVDGTGTASLATASQNNDTLLVLSLDDNMIGDEGTLALAECLLSNTILLRLGLRNNKIGNAGAMALARSLRGDTKLQKLNLDANLFRDRGTMEFANALMKNRALRKLKIGNCIHRSRWTLHRCTLIPSKGALSKQTYQAFRDLFCVNFTIQVDVPLFTDTNALDSETFEIVRDMLMQQTLNACGRRRLLQEGKSRDKDWKDPQAGDWVDALVRVHGTDEKQWHIKLDCLY